MEERIEPTNTVQTEFDEWVKSGLNKAAEIINKSDTDNIKQ